MVHLNIFLLPIYTIMAKNQSPSFNFRSSCCILVFLSIFSSIPLLYWSYSIGYGYCHNQVENDKEMEPINLLKYPKAWNQLVFSSKQPPTRFLKIALFVKKWPEKSQAGGMERHALTLYLALAKRGHDIHIFTTSSSASIPSLISNLHFHISRPMGSGYLNQAVAWNQFLQENATKAFDVIHSESVGLRLTRSNNYLNNLAVSWHGIAYETIHSDIIQELVRNPQDSSSQQVISDGKMMKVVEEVKFFQYYAHHVATSDHVGDVLKRIYMIPEERVHIILNGVDEEIFKPDVSKGNDFLSKLGIDQDKSRSSIILGLSGRLVKDKGHPLMFEALQQIFKENSTFKDSVIVLIAGNGPWGDRYRELGSNLIVLGPLERAELASFYNAIDIFVHPTLRAQGLDQVPLEAFLTGKPVMATKLASFTESVIVNGDMGYTFSPRVSELKRVLYEIWEDGKKILEKKGGFARERGLKMFTATKMVAAYERLFLCISANHNEEKHQHYCVYQPNEEMD